MDGHWTITHNLKQLQCQHTLHEICGKRMAGHGTTSNHNLKQFQFPFFHKTCVQRKAGL